MDVFLLSMGLVILTDEMKHNDEELMLCYQKGDNSAFEILYRRHKDALYRYLLRQCGNKATAEELFQDVWMKLIRAQEHYQVKAKFSTYLYHMAHNRLIDYYRKQSRCIPVSYDDCIEDGYEPASVNTLSDPESLTLLAQQNDFYLNSVHSLPEAQREAFLLREEAGLSIEEIANVTGVNSETAKSRLRYAVNKLRQMMRGLS